MVEIKITRQGMTGHGIERIIWQRQILQDVRNPAGLELDIHPFPVNTFIYYLQHHSPKEAEQPV